MTKFLAALILLIPFYTTSVKAEDASIRCPNDSMAVMLEDAQKYHWMVLKLPDAPFKKLLAYENAERTKQNTATLDADSLYYAIIDVKTETVGFAFFKSGCAIRSTVMKTDMQTLSGWFVAAGLTGAEVAASEKIDAEAY